MIISISFPNFLCLLLTGVMVVHLFSRDPITVSLPEAPDSLEAVYCKLPQSYRLEDSSRCSSTQSLFALLGNDCTLDRKERRVEDVLILQNETDTEQEAETEDGSDEVVTVEVVDEEVEEEYEEKPKEKTTSFADSFVITLLVCSAVVSLMEWYKEKRRSKEQQVGAESAGTAGGETVGDRRISLADLTVNRHIRRQDSQQLEGLRQNSISSGAKRPPLIRRSSFPAQFPEVRTVSRHAPQRQQSTPGLPPSRRMSIDHSEDDASPDRRRVRMIRRH